MAVGGAVEAGLVVLGRLPLVVEGAEPLVHLQVVQGHVGDDLLLDDAGVGGVVDAVLGAEGLELGVSVQACLHGFWDLVSEVLDQVHERDEVRDGALGGLVQDGADEVDDLLGGGLIDAGHDGSGVGQLVLLEGAVQGLLEDLLVGQVGDFNIEVETVRGGEDQGRRCKDFHHK